MLLAAGFAVLGMLAMGAGPVARRWARSKGHSGNLKTLLLRGKAQAGAPAKVPVHYFEPTGKRAEAASEPENSRSAATGGEVVFQVAVPKGTSTAILRGEWDLA